MHPYANYNIISNSQVMKATYNICQSTDKMDKEIMIYIYI